METLDSREPKEMSGEKGVLDCWDFQVNPVFLEELISPCLNGISYEEWMSLDTNDSGSEAVVLLSDMCSAVIRINSNLILEIVEPLIFTSGHDLSCGDDVTVQGGCSNFKVMEENIEACFGKSLNQYFVEALDIAEGSCDTLDELVRLFSAEVTKKVNSSLAQVTGSTLSLNTCDSLRAESTLQMVDTIGKLFTDVLEGRKIMDESCDELACPPCNSQERWCFDSEDAENVEEDSTEISGFSFSFSEMPEILNNFNPEPVPLHYSQPNDDINPISLEPPPPAYNKTFLTVLLAKLVDHIASETGASLENMDLDQLVFSVTWLIWGKLDLSPLRSVGNLHISIYKSLRKKFTCIHVLMAAMESGDDAFDLAVSETLISQLKKYKTSKNTWNFFEPISFSEMPGLDNLPAPSVPQHSDDSESNDDINPISSDPPPPDYNKTALTVILSKLVDHIASETGASFENVNVNDLVSCVTWCTKGMLDLSPLRSDDKLHISIYESLCQKFRSKHMLQAAMVSHDSAFEFGVIMTLLSHLEKYKTSNNTWNTWNLFEPGNLSPVIESQTPELHREERSTQTTPSPPKRSMCSTLRKKFSRWASNVVNFFKRSGQ